MEDKSHLCVSNYSIEDMSVVPLGLHVIYSECRRLYPDQPNPLQVTANLKYWYVMYRINKGLIFCIAPLLNQI